MKLRKMLLVLVVALAMAPFAVMADPLAVTADVTVGFILNSFDGAAGTTGYVADANLYLKSTNVDDYNTAYINIGRAITPIVETVGATAPTNVEIGTIQAAYIQTDLAKFMGLAPEVLTWTILGGFANAVDNGYLSQTAQGTENISASSVATSWQLFTTLKAMDLVSFRAGVNPVVVDDYILGVFATPSFGPETISIEAFFDSNAQVAGTGAVIVDGRSDTKIGDLTLGVGAGVRYDLGAPASSYSVGASVKGTYSTLGNLAMGFLSTDAGAQNLVFSTSITPNALVTFDGAVNLSLVTGSDMFQGADLAVIFNIGNADIYLGYQATSMAKGNVWAPVALTDGGAYIKMILAF